jgi:hypothetical protein
MAEDLQVLRAVVLHNILLASLLRPVEQQARDCKHQGDEEKSIPPYRTAHTTASMRPRMPSFRTIEAIGGVTVG